MNHRNTNRAKHLPFLEAVCWDLHDVYCLTPAQMLTRYEKGLEYEGILGELEPDERAFFKELKKHVNWLKIAAQPNGDWSRDARLDYLSVTLLPDEDEMDVRAVQTMAGLISTVIPEWRESVDWLYNAIDSGTDNASNTAYGRWIRYRNNLPAASLIELRIEEW